MNKEFYKRNLPHYQPLGGTFFVTFNLADAIPSRILKEWKKEFEIQRKSIELFSENLDIDLDKLQKLDFAKREKYLDSAIKGKNYLKIDEIAQMVAESLHFWDSKKLDLLCYCIMSNHVHFVARLFDSNVISSPKFLQEIMHSIKRFSAQKCNEILGLSGQFWQHESYDRLVRNDEELFRIMLYVINNPVKVGLVKKYVNWKWTYISARFKTELFDI